MDVLKDLYQQLIIDHNQNPRNFMELKGANHFATGHNPLCGDELNVYLSIQNGNIKEITFTGSGCAISKASASMMTSTLKGMHIKDAEMKFNFFLSLATTGNVEEDMGKLSVLAGVHKYPARVKCATLAWHTFYGALHNIKELIKTE